MRLIVNPHYRRPVAPKLRAALSLRQLASGALRAFGRFWEIAFPMPPVPTDPDTPSPIARAAALREPALLSENLEADETKKTG